MKTNLSVIVLLTVSWFMFFCGPLYAGDEFLTQLFEDNGYLLAQNNSDVLEDDGPGDEFEDEFDDELMEDFEGGPSAEPISDPLYYFNYAMYSVNDFFYFYALKPVATGYKAITPEIMRKGVNNFFHNLLFPVRFVNNLLQGKVGEAGEEVGIFLVNTTVGILGFSQVAQDEFEMYTSDEDLGQTLGSYTIGNGFYIVWPILGPSTLRDSVGLVGDYFLTPVNYIDSWKTRAAVKSYDVVNATTFRLGDYEALKEAALDPYVAIRDAYVQNRIKKIKE